MKTKIEFTLTKKEVFNAVAEYARRKMEMPQKQGLITIDVHRNEVKGATIEFLEEE